jgi:hypothetical protein
MAAGLQLTLERPAADRLQEAKATLVVDSEERPDDRVRPALLGEVAFRHTPE